MIKTLKHYKTIVLSDIHLGSKESKTKEVIQFLKSNSCDTLILCGDIIDGRIVSKGKKANWGKQQAKFMKLLIDLQLSTKIICLAGNHDDFLEGISPFEFYNIQIARNYSYTSGGKRYLVTHGDVFDMVTGRLGWIPGVATWGYSLVHCLNKWYNGVRRKRGLTYDSLFKRIKGKRDITMAYILEFERYLAALAGKKKYDGVICGHIHYPAKKEYDGILYLNSGDWVKSLSALTEDKYGNWEVVLYEQEKDSKGHEYMELLTEVS